MRGNAGGGPTLAASWKQHLEEWSGAGLIDAATVERIRAYEAGHEKAHGLRWPVLLAIGLGGLLLGGGVLLFVAAHWDGLSPAARFSLVLGLVALFHIAGALTAERFAVLSGTLHAVGTVCLGAGIFLAGQIFHLEEHWPTGVMLWALGAGVGWALLRDWPQAALVALLAPAWLGSEWIAATHGWGGSEQLLVQGLLLLALTYLTALLPGEESATRKALAWIGGLAVLPLTVSVLAFDAFSEVELPGSYLVLGWAAALALPLGLAWGLRREAAWMNGVAALWVIVLGMVGPPRDDWSELGIYLVCALGAIGLIAWGLKEARKERINLGVAGFALTVLVFYFSNVMDKLGRATSLIGLGLLFLLGGWLLEKARRRLVAQLEEGDA